MTTSQGDGEQGARDLDTLILRNVAVIVLSVSLSTAGQTSLKLGLNRLTEDERHSWVSVLMGAPRQPLVYLGLALFVLSVLTWMTVLAGSELSWSYPLLGLSYVFVALSGWLVFGEALTPQRLLGIAVVIVGAVIIAGS
jgi:drug/metabolite transporter (DMT)-like permease